jgi:hypothetical protein
MVFLVVQGRLWHVLALKPVGDCVAQLNIRDITPVLTVPDSGTDDTRCLGNYIIGHLDSLTRSRRLT